jgi:methylated-DNA-[protein]-cysteine S-methyltransferase
LADDVMRRPEAGRRGDSQQSGGGAPPPAYIRGMAHVTENPTYHHLFETALGICGVAWNEHGLAGVQLPEKDRAATERRLAAKSGSAGPAAPPPWVEALAADIQKYLAGEKIDFSAVRVDLGGVDGFRRRIYEALRGIAFGRTTTYGELARTLGATDWEGARDVGDAMGRNPVPIVIPCHRVLAAGNKLGGFSAHGGTRTKQKLLALEGVSLDSGPPRLPGL